MGRLDKNILIGITGGIGSGKTIVSKILQSMGYPVFSSDTEAKRILIEDPQIVASIQSLFGKEAYLNEGGSLKVNRALLADQIFKNPNLRNKLNALIHPKVRSNFDDWANANEGIIFNEAAILFETGSYKNFDKILLVVAPEELRIARVMNRDQVDHQKVKDRINAQWTDEQKIPLSQFVIHNDEKRLILPQVLAVLENLNHELSHIKS